MLDKVKGFENPVKIEEILLFVETNFPGLNWKTLDRFGDEVVYLDLKNKREVVIRPFKSYDGQNRISFSFHYSLGGHTGPLSSFDVLKKWIEDCLKENSIIFECVQLSLF